jgi:hypothetical protein
MFDTILGLPVHALVVHAVVVLVPLGSIGVIAMAAVPRWRERFGWAVLAILTIGVASVPVATKSGHKLKDRLHASGTIGKQIQHHETMGNRVIYPAIAVWVLGIALYLLHRRGRTGAAVTVVAVLAALAGVAAIAQVTYTGHLGSTAVWSCTIGSSACK